MQVLEAKNECISNKVDNPPRSISQDVENIIFNNPEHFKKLQERINSAFSESERRNDDMVLRVKKDMVGQTVASILEAEEQNDNAIAKIMHPITNKSR
jgi:hypothetical protein